MDQPKLLARKRPIEVFVEFATRQGVLETLEGRVSYVEGDALVTGSSGERWPIRRRVFEESYDPAGMHVSGVAGTYRKRPLIVQAHRSEIDDIVPIDGGDLHAKPGDWIVTAPNGSSWVVAEAIFAREYEVLGGDD